MFDKYNPIYQKMLAVARQMINSIKVKKLQINMEEEWIMCDYNKIKRNLTNISALNITKTTDDTLDETTQNNNIAPDVKTPSLIKPPIVSLVVSQATPPVIMTHGLDELVNNDTTHIFYDIYHLWIDAILESEIVGIFYFLNDITVSLNGI